MMSTILCLDSFTKECSSDSISFVILTRTGNFLHFDWKMDQTIFTMNLWLWACQRFVILQVFQVLRIFFKLFEDSWIFGWNSSVLERLDPLNFNNLEFLKFMEAFELDFNRTSSLGRMIQVNSFECSLFVLEAEFLQSLAYWKLVGEWERSVLYL